ncbi:hypothetical protein [Bradyrhizobium sp. RT3a]|uniref:hypothetical protein n=1 Tax=unclassified Bradyrhizobium TaxID=2631580 RepID=UPI003391AED4
MAVIRQVLFQKLEQWVGSHITGIEPSFGSEASIAQIPSEAYSACAFLLISVSRAPSSPLAGLRSSLNCHQRYPTWTSKKRIDNYRKMAIPAEAIASAMAYAIGQPANVDVNEILIRPTAQPT